MDKNIEPPAKILLSELAKDPERAIALAKESPTGQVEIVGFGGKHLFYASPADPRCGMFPANLARNLTPRELSKAYPGFEASRFCDPSVPSPEEEIAMAKAWMEAHDAHGTRPILGSFGVPITLNSRRFIASIVQWFSTGSGQSLIDGARLEAKRMKMGKP